MLKKWEKNTRRYYHFTHVHHKWQSYNVWFLIYGAQRIYFFVILDHFVPFCPTHIVHPTPPPFSAGGRGLNLQPNFQKGDLDWTSPFREGLLGKRGVTFFRRGCSLHIKNRPNRISCHFGPFFALLPPL